MRVTIAYGWVGKTMTANALVQNGYTVCDAGTCRGTVDYRDAAMVESFRLMKAFNNDVAHGEHNLYLMVDACLTSPRPAFITWQGGIQDDPMYTADDRIEVIQVI